MKLNWLECFIYDGNSSLIKILIAYEHIVGMEEDNRKMIFTCSNNERYMFNGTKDELLAEFAKIERLK